MERTALFAAGGFELTRLALPRLYANHLRAGCPSLECCQLVEDFRHADMALMDIARDLLGVEFPAFGGVLHRDLAIRRLFAFHLDQLGRVACFFRHFAAALPAVRVSSGRFGTRPRSIP
jgi:hypothetical protein